VRLGVIHLLSESGKTGGKKKQAELRRSSVCNNNYVHISCWNLGPPKGSTQEGMKVPVLVLVRPGAISHLLL
jgi:hypothetical protein